MVNLEGRFAWVERPADVRILERLLAKERAAFRCFDEWRPSPEQKEAARQAVGYIPPPPDLARLIRAHTEAVDRLQQAEHRIAAKQAGLRPAQIPSLPAVARGDKSPKSRAQSAFLERMTDYARLLNARMREGAAARRTVQKLQAIVEQPFKVEMRNCEQCGGLYPPLTRVDRYCKPSCQHAAEEGRRRSTRRREQMARVAESEETNIAQMLADRDQHYARRNCCSREKPCNRMLELESELIVAQAAPGHPSRTTGR